MVKRYIIQNVNIEDYWNKFHRYILQQYM